MVSQPLNKTLYKLVTQLANEKFKAPSSIYRSSWIVREYKKRGGMYSGTIEKNTGLHRWYKENWIDLNRPNKDGTYQKCGRSNANDPTTKYPLCRPSKRITKETPKTYKQLTPSSIQKAKKDKAKVTYKKHISFKK